MSFYRQGPHRPGGYGMGGIGVPPVTPMVRMIMIACAAVWLAQFALYQWIDLAQVFGVVPRRILQGWIWQPFTSMFLHDPGGIMHILFNMLLLWMFGSELERLWGSRPFLRYYLVCGVGAGIAAVVFGFAVSGMQNSVTIGASGAVFGLIIAYGIVFAERTILFMLIFPMKARTLAMIMFAIAFVSTLRPGGGGVSHISHLGGAVVGFLYLKRAWRVGDFYRELQWRVRRRRFKVMQSKRDDPDHWVN